MDEDSLALMGCENRLILHTPYLYHLKLKTGVKPSPVLLSQFDLRF